MKKNRLQAIREVYDACHDFLSDQSGPYPSWQAVEKASRENRLRIIDLQEHGSLEIVGENACKLHFKVD